MKPMEFIAEPVRYHWKRGLLVAETRIEEEVVGRYVMARATGRQTLANLREALETEPVRQSAVVLPLPHRHR